MFDNFTDINQKPKAVVERISQVGKKPADIMDDMLAGEPDDLSEEMYTD
ncbi:MAG: hypothetical protein GX541_04765 [Clostridiales bacterium]|jgi:hypothetical protein|nr:hypothetical protein [Clostridiales bacterium]